MSKFRYTMEDLEKSDMWLLLRVIADRKDSCTNIYSPLYKRLTQLQYKIAYKKKLTDRLVPEQWFEEDGK